MEQDRRKFFYHKLKDRLKSLTLDNLVSKHKITKGKLTLWFNDEMQCNCNIITYVSHHKKDEFGVYFELIISNGRIYRILNSTNLFNDMHIFEGGRLYITTNYHIESDNTNSYNFYLDTNIDIEIDKIIKQIEQFALPIAYGFLGNNYTQGILDTYNTNVSGVVSNPFYIGVILCILNGTEHEIHKIIEYARSEKEKYHDFSEETYQSGIEKVKKAMSR